MITCDNYIFVYMQSIIIHGIEFFSKLAREMLYFMSFFEIRNKQDK